MTHDYTISMLSAASTTPTSPFVMAPPGSMFAWTIAPTVGNLFSFFTKQCSNASVCAFPLQPSKGSCLPKSTQPLPSYTPTIGHSSGPLRFCAGTWALWPPWTILPILSKHLTHPHQSLQSHWLWPIPLLEPPLTRARVSLWFPLTTKTPTRGESSRGGKPTGSSPYHLPPPKMESRWGTRGGGGVHTPTNTNCSASSRPGGLDDSPCHHATNEGIH